MVQQYVAVIDKEACRPHRSKVRQCKWVVELASSLRWQTLIQYRFKKHNHINVNEEIAYRSLIKHMAKVAPSSRFCVLLDSQVVQGCNAKGRSSSQHLNCYLGSVIPYLLGANLYPSGIHIPSKHNPADDPSRGVRLRAPALHAPAWLLSMQSGQLAAFDAVRAADALLWPLSGWARLIRLSGQIHAPKQARGV